VNQLPPTHQKLLTAAIAVAIAAFLVWFLAVRPKQQLRDQLVGDNRSLIESLNKRNLPSDPAKLRNLQENQIVVRDKLRQRYNDSWDRAMVQFQKQLDLYDSPEGFRKSITLLDYQELFLEVKAKLAARDVLLDEEILGLTETSGDPKSYRIYTQLLLVRDVANLAREHNLLFHDPDSPRAPKMSDGRLSARLSALPVRTYATTQDSVAFVEEFSLRCSVTGTTADFTRFLAALTGKDNFVACRQIALEKAGSDGDPTADRVTGTLVCSAYLMLRDKEDTRPPETEQKVLWEPGA
jgi:hypothetical protein